MIICSQSSKLSSMGICSYIHFIKVLKSKKKLWFFFCTLCLNLFGYWVRRLKVTKHFIYSIYPLDAVPARSQVVVPSKRGHVTSKAGHTGLHYISHLLDGDSSNPGYLQGRSGLKAIWKHNTIAKGCPNYIASFFKVLSCSNSKTFCQFFFLTWFLVFCPNLSFVSISLFDLCHNFSFFKI